MQFSKTSKEHIDSCRFCWMCRHVCPIGNATGQERNTSRARALSLSLVTRGGAQFSPDMADNIYECALCGGCTNNCVTGWDPIIFTKEARREAALDGLLPAYISKLVENLNDTGNVYGETAIDSSLAQEIGTLPKNSDTLLFLGQDARCKSPENAVNAIKLLKKAGVDFTVLENEPGSGYAWDFLTGATSETKEAMTNAAKHLNFKKIIAYDPCDAKVFLREYKEWNIGLTAEVVTFTSFAAKLLADGKLTAKKSDKKTAFQDPVHLVRDLEETEAPRSIVKACARLTEPVTTGKETIWAGGTLMAQYMPEVIKNVARNRWNDVSEAEVLVTACPGEYESLKAVKPEDKELITIEQLLLKE